MVSTNPLPPPPKPLNSEFIESLHRPPTSRTRQSAQSSIPSHINGNNRGNVPRPAYDPVIPANPTFNNSPAVPEHRPKESESLQERKPRPPIMIPGAHPTKKVVPRPDYPGGFPMPPADPADFLARQSDYAGSYFGDPSAHRAAPSSSRWSTEVGTTTRASTYGYPPFPGNVPPVQEDWHSATSRSHDVERPAPALGSLRLYSDATQYPSHHRESPTIEEAARAIGVTGPDFRQNGTSRGRGEDHTSASSSSVNGQANTYPPSTPSVPQANNSLDLHVAPTSPSVLSAAHINGQSLLGLTRPEDVVPPRPEPSPASTWGTVPTPTPHPSNGSSMIDLGLRGLPAAAIGSEVSLGDLGLTNLPPPGVPSGNSVEGDYDLTSLSLGTLSIDDANSRTGIAVDTSSSVESSHSNLTSSSSHHRSREHHVINGHPADSRENSSTRQPNVNDNISRLVRRTSHVPDPEPSGNRSRESSGSSSGTSSRVSSRNESITDLVSRSSRGLRHGSSHETKERGSQGSSDSVVSYDMGISTTSQTMRVVPGPSIIRSVNGHDGKSTKDRRRRVSFGPVAHEIVEVHPHHAEHVEDPSQLMTPKGKPMLYSHSKSSRHQHSASLGEGLGLSLSSSSSASSRQGITNEDDLNLVDQSLMQLVNGESREHSHHRHAHHPSTANPLEQHPVHHVGPRTGYVIYSSGPPSGHVSQGSPSTEPSTLPSTERRPPVPLERRSASDTHPGQDFIMHGNSRDDTIRPRRRASASTATLSSTASSAHGNRHTPHVHSISSTENHYIHHAEEANDLSRRSSKRHRQTPGPEVVLPPSSEYPPTVGGSSLLLSFTPAPPGPNTSAATTADGEPSSIYAPRPMSSRHTSNLFGLWNARTDR